MITLLLTTLLFAADPCQNLVTESPQYKATNTKIVIETIRASNLVPIATEADSVLAKLIGAKSPVLMNWLQKRELLNAREEIIAREWRKYYLENFILGKFPTKNSEINKSVEGMFEEINKAIFNIKFKNRLNKIFGKVQKDATKLVSSWKIDEKSKKALIHKVETMKLYWFEKLEGTRYSNKPLEFLKWGVAYDPPKNEINVGVHALKYPTDANLYAVLSHEVGHSFDPCRWSAFFQGKSPFEDLYKCLRSDKSVGAKSRDDSLMNKSVEKKLLTKEMAQSLKLNPTCNRTFYPPEGTQKDQLPETFSDWFSAELFSTSSYKKEFPRPDLCNNNKLSDGSSYIANRERIDKIYLVQPQLKKVFKSQTKTTHCSL